MKRLSAVILMATFGFTAFFVAGVLSAEEAFKWQKPGDNKFMGTADEAMAEFNRLGIPESATGKALADSKGSACAAVTLKKGDRFDAMVSGKKNPKTGRFTVNQPVMADWVTGVELTATECEADGYRFIRADVCSNWLVVKATRKAELPPPPPPPAPEPEKKAETPKAVEPPPPAVTPQAEPVMHITINVVWWHPALQAAPTIDSRDIDPIVRHGLRAGFIKPYPSQELFDARWLNSSLHPITVTTLPANRNGVWTSQATIAIRAEQVTRELVLILTPRSNIFLTSDPSGRMAATRVGEMKNFLENWRAECGGNLAAPECGTPEMVFHFVVMPPPAAAVPPVYGQQYGAQMQMYPPAMSTPVPQMAQPMMYPPPGPSFQFGLTIDIGGKKHRRHH